MKHFLVVRKWLSIKIAILLLFFLWLMVGIIPNLSAAPYCKPIYTAIKPTWIKVFKLDTFTRNTTVNNTFYDTNYVGNPIIALYNDKIYELYANDSNGTSTMNGLWGAWIDYNNDGDFDDAGELIDTSAFYSPTFKVKWKIPRYILPNNYRIRIRLVRIISGSEFYGMTNGTCKSFYTGSTHDYLIKIKKSYHTDAALLNLLSPSKPYCGDSNNKFTVEFKNYGKDTIRNLPFSLIIQPIKGISTFVKDTLKRILIPNEKGIFTFSYTLNASAGGTFYFYLYTDLPYDSAHENDSIILRMNLYPLLSKPSITMGEICKFGDMQKVYALKDTTGLFKTYWYYQYDSAFSKPVAIGDTAYLKSDKTQKYYVVKSRAEYFESAPKDTTLGITTATGHIQPEKWGLGLSQNFELLSDIIIDTIAVYPSSSGTIHFVVYDSKKYIYSDDSFSIIIKHPLERVEIPLWKFLPKGVYFFSALNSHFKTKNDGLYYNTSGMTSYFTTKYSIIYPKNTGNSEYDFFYNWRMSTVGCKSKKVDIEYKFYSTSSKWKTSYTYAKPMEILFTPKDSTHTTYLWHFGDGDSSTNATPTHQYKKDSSYKVSLKITNKYGCDSMYDSIIQVHYTGIIQLIEKHNIVIRPNPATNTIHISGISNNSITEIRDMQGRYIMQMATGKEETDISSLPKGMYIVTVKNAEGIWVGKFVKEE